MFLLNNIELVDWIEFRACQTEERWRWRSNEESWRWRWQGILISNLRIKSTTTFSSHRRPLPNSDSSSSLPKFTTTPYLTPLPPILNSIAPFLIQICHFPLPGPAAVRFPLFPLHLSPNASVDRNPIAATTSSSTPRYFTPINQSARDGMRSNLAYYLGKTGVLYSV